MFFLIQNRKKEWVGKVACYLCNQYKRHHIKRVAGIGYRFECCGFLRCFEVPPGYQLLPDNTCQLVNAQDDRMWGNIPMELRGGNATYVGESKIPNAEWGLSTSTPVTAGTSIIYGGTLKNLEFVDAAYSKADTDYMLIWPEFAPYGIIGRKGGASGPQANEPCYLPQDKLDNLKAGPSIYRANCTYLNSIYGLYLVVCEDLDANTELLVHYGEIYNAPYKRPLMSVIVAGEIVSAGSEVPVAVTEAMRKKLMLTSKKRVMYQEECNNWKLAPEAFIKRHKK